MAGEHLPVRLACRVLHIAESGCYAWHHRPPSKRLGKHAWPTEAIVDIHTASRGTYGSRRVQAELGLGLRIRVSQGAVELLMQLARTARIARIARTARQPAPPRTSPRPSPAWWSGTSPVTPRTSYGSPISRSAPLLRARCTARWSWTLLAPGGGLVDRRLAHRGADHQRRGHGHRQPRPAAGRHHHPLRSRSAVRAWAFTWRAGASGLLPSMGSWGTAWTTR